MAVDRGSGGGVGSRAHSRPELDVEEQLRGHLRRRCPLKISCLAGLCYQNRKVGGLFSQPIAKSRLNSASLRVSMSRAIPATALSRS
jgi:hypothetical protein